MVLQAAAGMEPSATGPAEDTISISGCAALTALYRIMAEYKKYSMVIGKDVFMISGNEKKPIKITDIDSEGALVALDEDNCPIRLSSGEISIRFD